jgi:ATP-dependent Clp protease adapter protein ClpS
MRDGMSSSPHCAVNIAPAPAAGPAEPKVPTVDPTTEPASPETEGLPEEGSGGGTDEPWRVILFNDEVHTFREVISQLVKATGCTSQKAEDIAWKVHTEGKAVAYEGNFEECFQVQAVLKEIQLVTEIEG